MSSTAFVAVMIALGVICAVTLILALILRSLARHAEDNPGLYQTPDVTRDSRKKGSNVCWALTLVAIVGTLVFYFSAPNFVSDAPAGRPLVPIDVNDSTADQPQVDDLGITGEATTNDDGSEEQTGTTDDLNGQSAENIAQSKHLEGGLSASTNETKGYYIPAVNPTADEIDQFLKDYDLENGSDNSLIINAEARRKAAAAMSGKYIDPVNFPLPEEYRNGFRQLAAGKMTEEEAVAFVKKFRHWLYQEMIWNPPYGEMILQTLNELDRVIKNNAWIPDNEAVVELFYGNKPYQQPQLGDAGYEKKMKIELYATPTATDPNVHGLDYLIVASETSATKFKPSVPWTRLMARTCILIDKYFDIENYVQYQSAHNWHMPEYKLNSNVRTKEPPVQVDEPAILFAYHHTTGEAAEFGSAEFGIVEDDCRTELYAARKAPKDESTPPPDNTPPPTNPPVVTPTPTSTPTPTPTPTPTSTPTPTPTPTGTPTPTPTPTPRPTKDPSKDPGNQGNAPIGSGPNSDTRNPGTEQPTKPPAISKPTPGVDETGSGQHNSTGLGGKPNSVTNPSGNTDNGDHPGQDPIKPDNSETWHKPTGGGGSTPVKPSESTNDDVGAFELK